MRWSEIPWTPPRSTLRQFALLGVLVLVAAATRLWLAQEHEALAWVLLGLAALVGVLGIAFPRTLRPVFVGWMVFVFPVSWLTSHLVLAVLYYCVFTPLGLLFQCVGRDVLTRRLRPDQDTYWVTKPPAGDMRSYFRQS